MNGIKSICVYCGSSNGSDPLFVEAARRFGRILAENKVRLVYGGGSRGLMGALAGSVLDHGGDVTGIIPEFLTAREGVFRRVPELIVTRDLHERKRLMFERASAFVALPGGIGTLEELVEQLTWAQLGQHKKPILIANIEGFWNPLVALLEHMKEIGFLHSIAQLNYCLCDTVEDILPTLERAAASLSKEEAEAGAAELVQRM